ncbi:hypothetical protein H5410_005088 [Solanum commersonii]|uniref:Uncharacterized protein n=1 Tax=Solanum commersonii TaxID=4109 RepID=A0A9J6A5G3_SOLCO|nr:hypothetical protein H5410_005088 [Solanum commersonii]
MSSGHLPHRVLQDLQLMLGSERVLSPIVVQVGLADLFGVSATGLSARQPTLFKHLPHFDVQIQHTIILNLKRKKIKLGLPPKQRLS